MEITKYEQLREYVSDILFDSVEEAEENYNYLFDDDEDECINDDNWYEHFENEYGFLPDEDDYKIIPFIIEFKREHNLD